MWQSSADSLVCIHYSLHHIVPRYYDNSNAYLIDCFTCYLHKLESNSSVIGPGGKRFILINILIFVSSSHDWCTNCYFLPFQITVIESPTIYATTNISTRRAVCCFHNWIHSIQIRQYTLTNMLGNSELFVLLQYQLLDKFATRSMLSDIIINKLALSSIFGCG